MQLRLQTAHAVEAQIIDRGQTEGLPDVAPAAGWLVVGTLTEPARARVPEMLAIFLDRPAVLTEVLPFRDVILANFGASDAAMLDGALGRAIARGDLPFALPRSMDGLRAQNPAAPDDSADPLYTFAAGL